MSALAQPPERLSPLKGPGLLAQTVPALEAALEWGQPAGVRQEVVPA